MMPRPIRQIRRLARGVLPGGLYRTFTHVYWWCVVAYPTLARRTVEMAGVKVRLGRHLSLTLRRELYQRRYEAGELAIVTSRLAPDDVVMELGTGLGLLATYCAKQIGSARVFTFEANPGLERRIRETFALNGVSPMLHMCVLGTACGETIFYVERDFWWSSTVRHSQSARGIRVPVRALNDEMRRIAPTFLIIDIEGGEYELSQSIDFHGVSKILIELHEGAIGRERVEYVKSVFFKAGFQIDEEVSSGDVVFLQRACSVAMAGGGLA